MTKQEAAVQMTNRRKEAGLTQVQMALATGLAQSQVSAFERGEGSSSPTAVAYLDLILKTDIAQLKATAEAAEKKLAAEKKRATALANVPLPALARELTAFRKRHRMTLPMLADLIDYSDSQTYRLIRGEAIPHDDKVADIRASMSRYEGKPVKVERPVTDKPGVALPTPKPAPAPKPIPTETATGFMQSIGKAAAPTFQSVNTEGVFLVNGTNLAPHLTLDGKTMHVFTVVPGGVFLSKLTVKEDR
jgi:DNA-binding XRE family transcriptional regulator